MISSHITSSLKSLATHAENTGFDSFWVTNHLHQISVVGNPHESMLESWTAISFLAGVTSKIKLGTLVSGVIYRHSSILAKQRRHWMF